VPTTTAAAATPTTYRGDIAGVDGLNDVRNEVIEGHRLVTSLDGRRHR